MTEALGGRTGFQRRTVQRFVFVAPVILFTILATLLGWGLGRNPQNIPSALIGKAVPEFALPPVQGRILGLAASNLRGEVSLVNVFASWCTACRDEHPLFMEIAKFNIVPLHGINYKDRPADAAAWLSELGDPYIRTGADRVGRVAIDWGVYGVPETYVVGADGRIAYKQVGPVTRDVLEGTILPLVERLRTAAKEAHL